MDFTGNDLWIMFPYPPLVLTVDTVHVSMTLMTGSRKCLGELYDTGGSGLDFDMFHLCDYSFGDFFSGCVRHDARHLHLFYPGQRPCTGVWKFSMTAMSRAPRA